MVQFNDKSRPIIKKEDKEKEKDKERKINTFDFVYALSEGYELTLNAFKSGIFLIKTTQSEGLKISTPKQVLQRLTIALAHGKQVKAGSTSENLLNEIRQIIYSLYWANEFTKKYVTV